MHAGDDPEDIDYLEVGPSSLQEKLLETIILLGYEKSRTMYGPGKEPQEFVQTFVFKNKDRHIHTLQVSFVSLNQREARVQIKAYSSGSFVSEKIIHILQDDSEAEIQKKVIEN